jgi:hypothetical protein
MLARPEQGPTGCLPELDTAIEASTGKQAFVWAETKDIGIIGMSRPYKMEGLACIFPDAYLTASNSSGGSPVLPTATDHHTHDGIKGLGKGTVTEQGASQRGILYLDALEREATQRKPREIAAP